MVSFLFLPLMGHYRTESRGGGATGLRSLNFSDFRPPPNLSDTAARSQRPKKVANPLWSALPDAAL
jgi:hypothetical protein